MNELCNTTNAAAKIRNTLLATASALVSCRLWRKRQAADDEPSHCMDRRRVGILKALPARVIIFVPPLDASTKAIGFPSLTTIGKCAGPHLWRRRKHLVPAERLGLGVRGLRHDMAACRPHEHVQRASDHRRTAIAEEVGRAMSVSRCPFTPTFNALRDRLF